MRFWLTIAILSVLLIACGNEANKPPKINLAVAANVRFALEELNTQFTSNTGIIVDMTVASSGKLTSQIQHGASFDVFLSANMKYPQFLCKKGLCVDSAVVYAQGELVVWSMKNIDFGDSLQVLISEGRIALANPISAPYGQAAMECLQNIGLDTILDTRMVFGQHVGQVVQYVVNEDVVLGFVNKSVVLSPQLGGKGYWASVDSTLYTPIKQGIVMIANTDTIQTKLAKQYYNFVLGTQAQKVFRKYGYKVNNP